MRVTVVKADGVVCVDGVCMGGIAMESLAPTLHAMQWYGDHGEEEHRDPVTRRQTNVQIYLLDGYAEVLAQWGAMTGEPATE